MIESLLKLIYDTRGILSFTLVPLILGAIVVGTIGLIVFLGLLELVAFSLLVIGFMWVIGLIVMMLGLVFLGEDEGYYG
jgi:hypothetical protein